MDYRDIRFIPKGNAVHNLYTEKTGLRIPPVKSGPKYKYLTFTAEQANSTIGYTSSLTTPPVIYKSTDGENWTTWDGTSETLEKVGDYIYVCGENDALGSFNLACTTFNMTGLIAASGDATTLLTPDGTDTLTHRFALPGLFSGCESLTKAPELPATTLAMDCYSGMFSGCIRLTDAPLLPAKDASVAYCYSGMFFNCRSLSHIKVLAERWSTLYVTSNNWVHGVSSSGVFEKPAALDLEVDGNGGIPTNWTIVNL